MYTKIAVFGVISAILVAATYTLSTFVEFTVNAEVTCQQHQGGTFATCTWTSVDGDGNIKTHWGTCVEEDNGDKQWKCNSTQVASEQSIPTPLKNALDALIDFQSSNDAKGPKTGVLDEPDALSDDEDEPTENGEDTEVPKRPGGLNNDDDAPTINPGLP